MPVTENNLPDALISFAYFVIPMQICIVAYLNVDLLKLGVSLLGAWLCTIVTALVALFIIMCGITHQMTSDSGHGAILIVKWVTAVVSMLAALFIGILIRPLTNYFDRYREMERNKGEFTRAFSTIFQAAEDAIVAVNQHTQTVEMINDAGVRLTRLEEGDNAHEFLARLQERADDRGTTHSSSAGGKGDANRSVGRSRGNRSSAGSSSPSSKDPHPGIRAGLSLDLTQGDSDPSGDGVQLLGKSAMTTSGKSPYRGQTLDIETGTGHAQQQKRRQGMWNNGARSDDGVSPSQDASGSAPSSGNNDILSPGPTPRIGMLNDTYHGSAEPLERMNYDLVEGDRKYHVVVYDVPNTSFRVFSARDITDLAREQEKALGSAKRQYLTAVAHDLKTPLTSFMVGLELIEGVLEENRLQDQVQGILEQLQTAGETLRITIYQALDVEKLEAGAALVPAYSAVNVLGLVQRCAILTRSLVADNVNVYTHVHSSVPRHFVSDADFLFRMMMNFLTNATKYTANGSITIFVHQPKPGELRIEVTDTGCGIPDDKKERLFQLFQLCEKAIVAPGEKQRRGVNEGHHNARAASNRTRAVLDSLGGSGMGLYSVAMLCRALDGECGVMDNEESKVGGSIFWFSVKEPANAAQHKDQGEAAHLQTRGRGLDAAASRNNMAFFHDDEDDDEIVGHEHQPPQAQSHAYVHAQQQYTSLSSSQGSSQSVNTTNSSSLHNRGPSLQDTDIQSCMARSASGQDGQSERRFPLTLPGPSAASGSGENAGSKGQTMANSNFSTATAGVTPNQESAASARKDSVGSGSSNKSIMSVRKFQILLVEDTASVRKLVTRALESFGHVVDTAGNGSQGLELIKAKRYDVCLVDFIMPIMGGLEMVTRAREWERKMGCRNRQYIVGMSANNNAEEQDKARRVGMDTFLAKPIGLKALRRFLVRLQQDMEQDERWGTSRGTRDSVSPPAMQLRGPAEAAASAAAPPPTAAAVPDPTGADISSAVPSLPEPPIGTGGTSAAAMAAAVHDLLSSRSENTPEALPATDGGTDTGRSGAA